MTNIERSIKEQASYTGEYSEDQDYMTPKLKLKVQLDKFPLICGSCWWTFLNLILTLRKGNIRDGQTCSTLLVLSVRS